MTLSAVLGSFAAIVVGIAAILVTAGFILNALDKIVDSRDRDAIRLKVEGFWFRTASLELHEQFQLALRSRYTQMRRLQFTFLGVFIFIAVTLAFAGAFYAALSSPADIKESQKKLIQLDLKVRYDFLFSIVDQEDDDEPLFGIADGRCTIGSGFDELRSIGRLGAIKAALSRFLDEHEGDALSMRLFNASVSVLVPLVLVLPLALGLFFSFNVTLWLLSRFTQSRLGAFLIVVADLVMTLAIPPVVSAVLLTLLTYFGIYVFGTVPDYSMFENPSWLTLIVSSVGVHLAMALASPVVLSLFAQLMPLWHAGTYMASSLIDYSYGNVKILLVDIGRVFNFDLNIGASETLINYAIGIDVLFSVTYIVPCLALVLMQRSDLTRRLFFKFRSVDRGASQRSICCLRRNCHFVREIFSGTYQGWMILRH
jgi:uncharacterized membrane protein